MSRQQTAPVLITEDGTHSLLSAMSMKGGDETILEAELQQLIHSCPGLLPIRDIDPTFVGAVAVCRELQTPSGYIDNFLVTPTGFPVLVECKLWRNAEARREVVGQILDYAKELALFTASDIQREAAARADGDPDALLKLVRSADPSVDEVEFNDALTFNLRRGRFLLLVVGEGIHERVERIADYLQEHAGLHFTFGLVELPFYLIPGVGRLVVPRILAKTTIVTRTVIALPDGFALDQVRPSEEGGEPDPETKALGDERQQFWREFLEGLTLDDPEQPVPRPARQGYLTFMLPAPAGSSWLTVYRDMRNNEVGVFLSSTRNSPGERAMCAIADDWSNVGPRLGGTAVLESKGQRPRIIDALKTGPLALAEERKAAFEWLRDRTNTFVSVLRPLVRSAIADDLRD